MKVFFASCRTDTSKRQPQRIASVHAVLKDLGCDVYDYIYDLESRDDARNYTDLMQAIAECDFYIAEMSQPSQTLGFQLAFALNSLKPCLYLYDSTTQGAPDLPLATHPSRLLKVSVYSSTTLQSKLQKFIAYGKKQLGSNRTSFMSTTEIDEYIDKEAQRRGMHKAEIIREVLHQAAASRRN